MKKISNKILLALLILLVLVLAYGQTLKMYFWQDDSALIFKLQHIEKPMGSFGAGPIGEGPYKYLVTPFIPFFPIFGLEPFGYFAVGLITYAIAVFFFYFFVTKIFGDKLIGFLSTLIFAAGYIGSDTMFRIINSWQTNTGLIIAFISFYFLAEFLKTNKIQFYFLSLIFFFFSVELVYIRSHSLIFAIFAIDFLVNIKKAKLKEFLKFVFRQVPFWLIFYLWYVKNESAGSLVLGNIFKSLLEGRIEVLSGFFATLGNVFVPDLIQRQYLDFVKSHEGFYLLGIFICLNFLLVNIFSFPKKVILLSPLFLLISYFLNKYWISLGLYWYGSKEAYLAGAIGLYFSSTILFFGVLSLRKNWKVGFGLLLGYLILASQIFGYFIQYPDAIFNTTHRYLTYGFIGYAIFWGVFFNFLKKYPRYIFLVSLVLTNLYLGWKYQSGIVKNRSVATREFYSDLKNYYPEIPRGAIFFFDVKDDSFRQQQFRDFFSVGSMPESTALAVYYGLDRNEIYYLTDLNELLFFLSKNPKNINKLFSFYYGDEGLVDTSEKLRGLLASSKNLSKLVPYLDMFPLPYLEINILAKLDLQDRLQPKPLENPGTDFVEPYLSYLLSRLDYYKRVSVNSLSEWSGQEVYRAVDNDTRTSWRGHRIYWHDNNMENIVIDLGTIKKISQLSWVNWSRSLTPISYSIKTSVDKNKWHTVKEIGNGRSRFDGERVIDKFTPVSTRYLSMEINKTLSNDAPALIEIEAVESKFDNIDILRAFDFIDNPLAYIKNSSHFKLLGREGGPIFSLGIKVTTDKGIFREEIPVGSFNKINKYTFYVPAGGTSIKNINLFLERLPVNLNIYSMAVKQLSLKEIDKKGLIKTISKN